MPPHSEFVVRSHELQALLRAAGYCKGDGVSTAGQRLVAALAKRDRLRQWSDTQTLADYDALIAVTRAHLLAIKVAPTCPDLPRLAPTYPDLPLVAPTCP